MNTPAPTFHLPACPLCSNLHHDERPFWRFAHNTSRKRGTNCYALSGCEHAVEVNADKIRGEPAEWALVEDAWAEFVERAFDSRTEGMPAGARRAFRDLIDGRSRLPGATDPLPLSPEVPAQQQQQQPE